MPRLDRVNVALNAGFDLADRNPAGTALTTGRPATCWTIDWTGSAAGVTFRTVNSPSDAPTYLRGKCMEIVVTASSYVPAALPILYQKVDNSIRHGQVNARMTLWAQGTDGGLFLFGHGDSSKPITYQRFDTIGLTGASSWKRIASERTFDDIATSLTLHAFAQPADMDATYRIGYVFEEYEHGEWKEAGPTVPILREKASEQALCASRCRVIGKMEEAVAISTTQIAVRFKAFPKLRSTTVQPNSLNNGSAVVFKPYGGADQTAATSVITFDATERGEDGIVAYVAGFSGLVVGQQGNLKTDIGTLEAEIA